MLENFDTSGEFESNDIEFYEELLWMTMKEIDRMESKKKRYEKILQELTDTINRLKAEQGVE